MTFAYPVFLDLTGVPVLVVGGGRVALRKVQGLAAAGAEVTVVAPHLIDGIEKIAARVEQRAYHRLDLHGHHLVFAATDDPNVNALVAADAAAAGTWVNSADDPANCSFILPAIARRGSVTVAVSTDGSSPALAAHLRDAIASHLLTERVESAAEELARQRAEMHAAGESTEGIDWSERVRTALGEH